MTQIHRPSRKQAVIFFIFTLLLVIGIFVWVFYLNKGTIIVSGKPPFTIAVADKEIRCETLSCEIKLTPRNYRILLKKESFFTDIHDIAVHRGDTQQIAMNLQFIPVVKEVGPLRLPHPDAPLLAAFRDKATLKNFPQNPAQIAFSSSGKTIIFKVDQKMHLYNIADEASFIIRNVQADAPLALIGEQAFFLETENGGHVLKMVLDEMRTETVVRFDRPFSNPVLVGAPQGNKLLIQEEKEAAFAYYLIDVEKKNRERLEETGLKNPHFTNFHIIFEKEEAGNKKIVALDPLALDEFELPAFDAENISESRPGVFLFLSTQRMDKEETAAGPAIDTLFKEITRDAVSPEQFVATVFITEFNAEKNTYRTFAAVPWDEKNPVTKLIAAYEEGKIYFVQGKRLFEIRLTGDSRG